MMYELKERNGVWQVHFKDANGERQRISTKTRDRTRAEAMAPSIVRNHIGTAAANAAMNNATASLSSRGNLRAVNARSVYVGVTLAEALRHAKETVWKDQASQGSRDAHIREIAEDHGSTDIGAIDYALLVEYGKVLLKRGNSNSTVNRKFSTLRVALREQHDLGVLPAIPKVPQYKEAIPKERYISTAEERSHLAEIDYRIKQIKRTDGMKQLRWKYFRALYVVLIDSGMRLSEALNIEAAHVRQINDEGAAEAWLPHGSTKSGRGRAVPLTARAYEALQTMLKSPMHGRTQADDASKMYRIVANACGHFDTKLHTLRHTCASRLVQAGVPIYTVSFWLGHSSVEMTKRYAHLSTDQPLRGALETLEQAQRRSVG